MVALPICDHPVDGLGIIPQDPVLLSGSLRYNLDPWDEHHDPELWAMVDSVGIGGMVRSLEHGLAEVVNANGANFSAGERQLICIARTLLRDQVRVLVLDEATASIDPKTDELVQAAIRKLAATKATIITIAHRLQTIADSDRIMVMAEGRVAQFGSPAELMQDRDGPYFAMAQLAGLAAAGGGDAGSETAAASAARGTAGLAGARATPARQTEV